MPYDKNNVWISYAKNGNTSTPRSEILFRDALDRAFRSLPCHFTNWYRDYNTIFDLIAKCGNPSIYFDHLGHGVFKETYLLSNTDNHAIKFCSQENDTEAEQAILEAAHTEKIDYAFVPTQFISLYGLTCEMPYIVDTGDFSSRVTWCSSASDYVENPNWEGRYATALEIQPYVEPVEKYQWWFENAYHGDDSTENGPLIDPLTGEEIEYRIVKILSIRSKQWLEAFLNLYGADELCRLANFVEEYYIKDLHNGNLGFIYKDGKRLPVILDWLSPTSQWIHNKLTVTD